MIGYINIGIVSRYIQDAKGRYGKEKRRVKKDEWGLKFNGATM